MTRSGPLPDTELAPGLARALGGDCRIEHLERLTGGASRETWAFDQVRGESRRSLILRRSMAGAEAADDSGGLSPGIEARLVAELADRDIPVPEVLRILSPEDGLGEGYVMSRLAGETLAPRILRREQFAAARERLARQCGRALAAIHAADTPTGRTLTDSSAETVLDDYRRRYDAFRLPRPVFELAFRWLAERLPPRPDPVLVHGDFRNGNLVVDEHGLVGVLDWELAHRGDPMEDLGWLTVNSWRFGMSHRPVGGFGTRRELLHGYGEAGGRGDAGRLRFWQLLGSLKWGVMCMTMADIYRRGLDDSVERAAIGRRVSEAEIDMLNIIRGRDP